MSKRVEFFSLCSVVQNCNKCPRMLQSQRVLNGSVGNLEAKIMFVGEAPGRLGADDTGIPFHGDKSGHNFEDLLSFANLPREQIYVTNAVLCNPKDENDNNATPIKSEISNCSKYLKDQIDLINPKIIVTLGSKALDSTKLIESHYLKLKTNVRSKNEWYNRILIPLYHPGQRAMIHRSMANQRSDYQFVSETLKRLSRKKRKITQKASLDVGVIIEYLLTLKPVISYFNLHKLFYLIEYTSMKEYGARLTNSYIVRQKDGPYCTELHLKKLEKTIPDLKSKWYKNGTFDIYKSGNNLFTHNLLDEFELEEELKMLIDKVFYKYGSLSKFKLKQKVYLTTPMRTLLKIEKEEKINLYNAPIPFETVNHKLPVTLDMTE